MLQYRIKKENTSNEVAYVPQCCPPPPGPGTNTGCDCCYESWTEELKTTSNQFKQWNAKANRLQQLYTNKTAWKDKLKVWVDDLESADEKADDFSRKITLFINQLNKICVVTTDTIRAIDTLFCIVIDLYMRVDDLKKDYDELLRCINNSGKSHPELASGTGILICLTEYGKKLQMVLDTRDNMIQSVANVIEIIHKLQEYLCINERHCGPERIDYGLVNILTYWQGIFKGTIKVNHGECKFEPSISLPIDQSDYYKKITSDFHNSKDEVKKLKLKLDEALEKKAAYQASMDGLAKALAEADPAIKCK